nr:alpha/beta hydrolase [Myroides oncorhynchi]
MAEKYMSFTPYAYVGNRPLIAVDPDGKRIYFVAGANNDSDGWNYVNRFANIFNRNRIRDFYRVNASGGKTKDIAFTSSYRSYSNVGKGINGKIKRRDHKQIEKAVDGIKKTLKEKPLKEGEQLNLAGYSYGSVLQAHVALRLADEGIKVDNLVLIGSPISDKSELYNALLDNENIGKVIREDIVNDKLSNPQSLEEFIEGGKQNSSDKGPHFNLARPGDEEDKNIDKLAKKLVNEGVK